MNYDLIIYITWFMIGCTVFGTLFAFPLKRYDGALACYAWASLTSLLVLTVDVTIVASDKISEVVTVREVTLETWLCGMLVGLTMLSMKYYDKAKAAAQAELERRSMYYPKMSIEDVNGRRGTFLVWVNRKAGRTPEEVADFFEPCENVEVTVLDHYAVVTVKDAIRHPDWDYDNVRHEIMAIKEHLTKPRDTDKEV